eukprot:CAMPEP_0172743342 /NCGR_PEP_ID=MMETSP1074-20121228/131984_1 /TAXON_ID=2916 /ORGANISM="Ceratium fusus, Strain PA161109" /LENGTH=46 /DNA_ID= /DNA_START= /DNA_END= /DNA_ORIENTATION=
MDALIAASMSGSSSAGGWLSSPVWAASSLACSFSILANPGVSCSSS